MILRIEMSRIHNIPSTVESFEDFFDNIHNVDYLRVVFDFNNCSFINPECITIVVALVNYAREMGIHTEVEIVSINEEIRTYISRMDFYRNIGVVSTEDFNRHDPKGRFLEMTKFDSDNSVDITNSVIDIIKSNCDISQSVIQCLNYCLFEVIDNVEIHAASPIDGFILVQNYPNKKEIRIVIVDSGVGICESLTRTEGSKYTFLNPSESLEYCIKEKVSNGKGMGNGLFHTSEFIKSNLGEMLLYSGRNYLHLNEGNTEIHEGNYWQGTVVYFKINTNIKVELESIFGDSIPETVANMEDYIDGDFSLW